MIGLGIPSEMQMKEAVFPLTTVTSSVLPAPSKLGGTEKNDSKFMGLILRGIFYILSLQIHRQVNSPYT